MQPFGPKLHFSTQGRPWEKLAVVSPPIAQAWGVPILVGGAQKGSLYILIMIVFPTLFDSVVLATLMFLVLLRPSLDFA